MRYPHKTTKSQVSYFLYLAVYIFIFCMQVSLVKWQKNKSSQSACIQPNRTKKGVIMCGMAKAYGTPDIDIIVKKMLKTLGHRGPDTCGTYQAENLSIGNTLLKITGDMPQPLIGKGALVLNGEIFNFRELASESGIEYESRIKTDSDTKVLFSLIETRIKEGDTPLNAVFSVLSSVNGDYALAYAFDSELVLARDPVGVKPFFFFFFLQKKEQKKPKIVFASEKKALFLMRKEDLLNVSLQAMSLV